MASVGRCNPKLVGYDADVSGHPGVSVVIPTRNRADSTVAAVRSALAQEWDALEVIVVNDASTDETAERVRELAASDPRVRLVTLEWNQGPSAARNRGVETATLPFVAFLDSDNTFVADKLRRQMPELIGAPAGSVSFSAYTIEGDGDRRSVSHESWSPVREAVIEQLMIGCCVNTSTLIAPRDVILMEGGFRTDLVCCEDHDLWLRLAAAGHGFIYCPEQLTHYRLHPGSLSADRIRVAESSERVIGDFLERDDLPGTVQARRRWYRAQWALNSAEAYLASGERRATLYALWRAACGEPKAVRPGWLVLAAKAAFMRPGFRRLRP